MFKVYVQTLAMMEILNTYYVEVLKIFIDICLIVSF